MNLTSILSSTHLNIKRDGKIKQNGEFQFFFVRMHIHIGWHTYPYNLPSYILTANCIITSATTDI